MSDVEFQQKRDRAFLRGFIEAVMAVQYKAAIGDPHAVPMTPEQYADRLIEKGFSRGIETSFPWAVENRVVKGPVIALFRTKEEAEEYADGFIDLRVRPVEEVLDLLH